MLSLVKFESTKETLFDILTDSNLLFDEHIPLICNKVRKINALGRIANLMSYEKRRLIMKTFIESQFNYCPLTWMFHSRNLNNKINRFHERTLKIACWDYKSSFNEFLQKHNSFTIYHRNIQSLSIEIYKFLNELSRSIMSDVFKQNQSSPYKLRNCSTFQSRRAISVKHGSETKSYLAPKILAIVPETIKNS